MTNFTSDPRRFSTRPNRLTKMLAVLLALLLGMPAVDWLTSSPGSSSPFLAEAQAICSPTATRIIQNVCSSQLTYLLQFESDAVQTYLAQHGLPSSDASLIYQYGRADLRAEVRALMMNLIVAAAAKKPADRTNVEANVLDWLVPQVQQQEIAYYGAANTEYQKWHTNPCAYNLDADVAAAQGLTYNRYAYCAKNVGNLFSNPDTPTLDYFLAVGWKASYGAVLTQSVPAASALLAMQQQTLRIAAATAFPAGLALGGALAAGVVANVNTLFPFAYRVAWVAGQLTPTSTAPASAADVAADAAAESLETVAETVPEVSEALEAATAATEAAAFSSVGASAASVVAVLLFAVETAVIAGINVTNQDATLAALATIPGLATGANTTPDIATLVQTSQGLTKLETIFISNTLPDFPSTANPASASLTPVSIYDFNAKQVLSSFSFNSPNGSSLTAQAKGGWFVLSGTDSKGADASSLTPTIHYTDWNGVERYASRIGPASFLIEKVHSVAGDTVCQASAAGNATTAAATLAQCLSYVSNSLQIAPGGGRSNLNLEIVVPRTFTSDARTDFTPATTKTFPITLSPAVNDVFCAVRQTGTLPDGIRYSNLTQTFNGTATIPSAGIYQETLTEYCGNNPVLTQNFTLNVATPLAFTSSANINYPIGQQFIFNITTTGAPVPKLTFGAVLPQGVTFKDNGNGTATLSGRPSDFIQGCLQIVGQPPITNCNFVSADNGVQHLTQNVTITSTSNFTQLHVVSPLNANGTGTTLDFPYGQTTSYNIQTAGGLAPISISMQQASDPATPSWLTFHDNGDGTGVISGSPSATLTTAPGIVGSVYLTPSWCCEFTKIGPLYSINLIKPQPDFIISPLPLTFLTVNSGRGTLESNSYSAGGTGITTVGTLPPGLALGPHAGKCPVAQCTILADVAGTPPEGSGGLYHVPFQISGNWGTATKTADILVYQAPAILGNGTVVFNAGVPAFKTIHASGYPLSPIGPLSNGLGYSSGTSFALWPGSPSLPAGITLTSGIGGVSNGTATLTYNGDKSLTGLHIIDLGVQLGPVNISGIASALVMKNAQYIYIYVVPVGDVNLDSKVDCSDLNAVKAALNTFNGQPGFNPALDVVSDGIINIKDVSFVAKNMPAGTVCQ